jgi:polysaccharide export outer membrane protein
MGMDTVMDMQIVQTDIHKGNQQHSEGNKMLHKTIIQFKAIINRKSLISLFLIVSVLINIPVQAEGSDESDKLTTDVADAGKVVLKATVTPPYVIGAGDELTITDRTLKDVFGQAETFTLTVAADGYITIPLPDGTQENILAAGNTLDDLSAQVRELFGKTLINPLVFVQISKYRPINLYIGGEVVKPGVYKVEARLTTEPFTVTEAIQLAGGLKPRADITAITITRGSNYEKRDVDLKGILTEGQNNDLNLQPGDAVYVKASSNFETQAQNNIPLLGKLAYQEVNVNVVGRVKSPGSITLGNDATLLDAIGKAGGVDLLGSTKKVKISRYDENGVYKTTKVNLFDIISDGTTRDKIALRPDDTIELEVSRPKVVAKYLRDTSINLYSLAVAGFVNSYANFASQKKLFEFVQKKTKENSLDALNAANPLNAPITNSITILSNE